MKHRIRSVMDGLKNLWKWRKVIYHDRNWDYWHIYQILKTKLEFQAEHLEKYGMHADKDKDVSKIREVIKLIDIVQNEKILDEALHEDKWSEESFMEADRKHSEAKKELFTKLHDSIEYWWD